MNNKEENEEKEKQRGGERISNQGHVFPSPYPAPATVVQQRSPKSDVNKEKPTDAQTATYWG